MDRPACGKAIVSFLAGDLRKSCDTPALNWSRPQRVADATAACVPSAPDPNGCVGAPEIRPDALVERPPGPAVTLRLMVRLVVSGLPGRAVHLLRDAGHEVVLVDPGVSAEQLAAIAVQEDVVAVALADTGVALPWGDVPDALAAQGADGVVVFATDSDE